jgi:hypothetical protein
MDEDVAEEMKKRIPKPHYGENLHQLLSDFGLAKFYKRLEVVYSFMQSSTSIRDFEERMGRVGPNGQYGIDLA